MQTHILDMHTFIFILQGMPESQKRSILYGNPNHITLSERAANPSIIAYDQILCTTCEVDVRHMVIFHCDNITCGKPLCSSCYDLSPNSFCKECTAN